MRYRDGDTLRQLQFKALNARARELLKQVAVSSRSTDAAMAPGPGAAQQAFIARLSPKTATLKRPTGVTPTGLTPDAKRYDADGKG